jgi:DNA-binding MarR family transcriptional regulator
MSRLVDGLVDMGLLLRRHSERDRRHVSLSVTREGEAAVREARQLAQAHLAEAVAGLPPKKRAAVATAMRILRDVFSRELTA